MHDCSYLYLYFIDVTGFLTFNPAIQRVLKYCPREEGSLGCCERNTGHPQGPSMSRAVFLTAWDRCRSPTPPLAQGPKQGSGACVSSAACGSSQSLGLPSQAENPEPYRDKPGSSQSRTQGTCEKTARSMFPGCSLCALHPRCFSTRQVWQCLQGPMFPASP